MQTRLAAPITVLPLVTVMFCTLCALGYLLARAIGLPLRLDLPMSLRVVGGVVLIAGCGLLGWLFRYRSPMAVLVSTYLTFAKTVRGVSASEPTGRTEPLVIAGPHRWVRHPYFAAVIVLVAGWWLVLDYTFLLFAAGLLVVWFNFVVIPFEERELRALFGSQYETYARSTPRMIPSLRRRSGDRTPR